MGRLVVVSVCLAASGCGGIFPDGRDVPQRVLDSFEGMRGVCDGDLGGTRLRATATDPTGGEWELWAAEGEPTGVWAIVPAGDDGIGSVAGAGCLPSAGADDELLAIGGLSGEGVALYAGRTPESAIDISIDGGPPNAVDAVGFFLVAIEGGYESGLSLDALDADGNVVRSSETM